MSSPVHLLVSLMLCLLLTGCSTVSYYSHLAAGQWQLLQARVPIDTLLSQPDLDPALHRRLALALQARAFASESLGLPDNGSYRNYADLQRPYVVWNLFATDEFSLAPRLSCFPIAGCVAYRGYYQESRARDAAALLKKEGADTYVAGIEAYSTLGWFDDPLLNTMLRWDDQRVIAVIFHELAHQRVYVADDTPFNESYASFVEREGLRQWNRAQGLDASLSEQSQRYRHQFVELVLAARERLQQLYDSDLDEAAMREAKQRTFERLRQDYYRLRDQQWQGEGYYDSWMNGPLNNARLLPFGLYDQWIPAFAELFARCHRDWSCFYQQVEALAALPAEERQARMQALMLNAAE